MEYIRSELALVRELVRKVRIDEAEARFVRLLADLTKEEATAAESELRKGITAFLPKRQRKLAQKLDEAKKRKSIGLVSEPSLTDSIRKTATPSIREVHETAPLTYGLPDRHAGLRRFEAILPTLRGAIELPAQTAVLARIADAILEAAGISVPVGADSLKLLFSPENGTEAKRIVLACIARVIAVASWPGGQPYFRVECSKLFDEVWRHEVYGKLAVDASAQTFEKWMKLESAVPMLERQIREALNSLSSLNVFGPVRQELMRAVNSALAREVIWPVVARELVTVRLVEVCSAVTEYIDRMAARDTSASGVRSRAVEILHSYEVRSAEEASFYARDYLASFARRLRELIEADFNASPFSKPAQITLRTSAKKYPLNAPGTECRISVTVESVGPGHAFDVELEYEVSPNLRVAEGREYLGNLEANKVIEDIGISCVVVSPSNSATVSAVLRWTNNDKTTGERVFTLPFEGQRTGIDWDALETEDPYSLEPVTEAEELVGRAEVLSQLTAKLTAKAVGSFFVYGQKRVGKTSLVRTLQARLKSRCPEEFLVIYLDGGDYVHPDPVATIERLGRRLCEELRATDRRFAALEVPTFSGALSPIDGFLRSVLQIAPNYRVVFVLDEFDELPAAIYRRGPVGDAFFLTLRSISAKPPFGFVLVGGENMEFILSTQGDALNKFQTLRIDYFDRDKQWSDFQDLIRRPTRGWLEISDEALVALYDQSAGNPFFAKLLCNELFRLVLQNRDAHVTPREVRESVRRALASIGTNRFQHFWEDGIFEETGDRVEERSMARRHLLLALADVLRRHGVASRPTLLEAAKREGIPEHDADPEIVTFERRQVLVRRGDTYTCKVMLFQHWLTDRGVKDIVTTFTDKTAILQRRDADERARVTEGELQQLVECWGAYKGRTVGPEAVRAWLAQFANVAEQRLMFRLLQGVRFYSADNIRAKMREAHGIVWLNDELRIELRQANANAGTSS